MDNNNINLSGKIIKSFELSHELNGERFYETEILTYRMSGNYDVVKVIVSDRLIYIKDDIKDKYVFIKGSIRTRNDKNREFNKLQIYVFVEEIDVISCANDDCIDMNYSGLDGFICKMSPKRETPFGRIICDFTIAVNRPYGKSDYIPCIAWGRNARYMEFKNIGDHLHIFGRLQSREYQKSDGEHTAYEFSVQTIEQ